MKSKRSKACDIHKDIKWEVWERDGGYCVFCGSPNAMPNAHYISRANGGLGIEQNIVTLCGKCHRQFDSGTAIQREIIGSEIRRYLKSKYSNWDENKLYYRK